MHTVNGYITAPVEKHQPRPRCGELIEANPKITVLGIAVNHALSDDGNVLGILAGDQRLIHRLGVTFKSAKVDLFPVL